MECHSLDCALFGEELAEDLLLCHFEQVDVLLSLDGRFQRLFSDVGVKERETDEEVDSLRQLLYLLGAYARSFQR